MVIAGAAVLYQFAFRPSASKMEVASKEKMAFPLPDKPSIAVLPFVNMSGDPKQEFFSDGITEEIITALSKITTSFCDRSEFDLYVQGKTGEGQAGERRSWGYGMCWKGAFEGRRPGPDNRPVDRCLNRTSPWAERYDRDLKDIFAVQDEITLKIVSALQVKLTVGEQARMTAKDTNNLEAYLKLMQVRDAAGRMTKEGEISGPKISRRNHFLGLQLCQGLLKPERDPTNGFDLWND